MVLSAAGVLGSTRPSSSSSSRPLDTPAFGPARAHPSTSPTKRPQSTQEIIEISDSDEDEPAPPPPPPTTKHVPSVSASDPTQCKSRSPTALGKQSVRHLSTHPLPSQPDLPACLPEGRSPRSRLGKARAKPVQAGSARICVSNVSFGLPSTILLGTDATLLAHSWSDPVCRAT